MFISLSLSLITPFCLSKVWWPRYLRNQQPLVTTRFYTITCYMNISHTENSRSSQCRKRSMGEKSVCIKRLQVLTCYSSCLDEPAAVVHGSMVHAICAGCNSCPRRPGISSPAYSSYSITVLCQTLLFAIIIQDTLPVDFTEADIFTANLFVIASTHFILTLDPLSLQPFNISNITWKITNWATKSCLLFASAATHLVLRSLTVSCRHRPRSQSMHCNPIGLLMTGQSVTLEYLSLQDN